MFQEVHSPCESFSPISDAVLNQMTTRKSDLPERFQAALTQHGSLRLAAKALGIPNGTAFRVASVHHIRSVNLGGRPRSRALEVLRKRRHEVADKKNQDLFTLDAILKLSAGFMTFKSIALQTQQPYPVVCERAKALGVDSPHSRHFHPKEDRMARIEYEDALLATGLDPATVALYVGVHPTTVTRRLGKKAAAES
jgi:hypothetical protein